MRPEEKRLRQLENGRTAIVSWAMFGNPKRAAASLKIAEVTLHKRVRLYCLIMGYDSPVQAAYALGKQAQIGTKAA